MPDRFFHYVCRATGHQQPIRFVADARWAPSPITLHGGDWSYCASGAPDGHDWVPTRAGETLEEVRRELRATA